MEILNSIVKPFLKHVVAFFIKALIEMVHI
uniref:Uncharacterized protein n=1 Tax=Siphoviridae sp. ct2vX3 TaxID=2825318 RepID=A0A8S5PXE4_9CAUD|nr:MAG TPA: hypothetical protein [Siphoviridae sp. ct2vX3]